MSEEGQHEAGVGAAVHGAAHATRGAVQAGRRRLRKDGAGTSGLATLVESCAVNSAGDALVAVALAGTVFFNVSAAQARDKVALYLLITMAPFSLLAPVIGPLLDKVHGRRIAMAATMVIRAFLCFALSDHHTGLELYPLALGILVTSKAFGIARAAVTPRVLPPGTSLVSANSRVTLVGAIAAGIAAPPALGLGDVVGITWVLRLASVVFLLAALPCLSLPGHVDTAKGETAATGLARETFGRATGRRGLGGLPTALRAVLCMKALVGFLTLFLAFEFRTSGSSKSGLAGLAAAALVGQLVGVGIGNKLSRKRPELLIASGLILATSIALVGAILYSKPITLLVALLATLGSSLAKLSLDAIIQRDIDEATRTSAFGRSETVCQLAWVLGGAVGLIPVGGHIGLSIAAAGMAVALVAEVVAWRRDKTDRSRVEKPDVLRRRQEAAAAGYGDAAVPQPTWPAPDPSGEAPTARVPAEWQRQTTVQPDGSTEAPTTGLPADWQRKTTVQPGPGGTAVLPFDDE